MVIFNLKPCRPECDKDGKFDEMKQLEHVGKEYYELETAYRQWLASDSAKNEASYLEEIADVMTSAATLMWAHTGGDMNRIRTAVEMVNLKNELRGYHTEEVKQKGRGGGKK